MRVTFKDGSFLEIMTSAEDKNKLTIIMCGFKGYNQLTMSSSDLSLNQVNEMIGFLTDWVEDLDEHFT